MCSRSLPLLGVALVLIGAALGLSDTKYDRLIACVALVVGGVGLIFGGTE